MRQKLVYQDITYKINGILFAVHNKLDKYCNEKQYCDAIEQGLKEAKLKYEREKVLPQSFLGEEKGRNKIDFLIEDKIVLEVKAKNFIGKEDYYQVRRYLDAVGKNWACLLIFAIKL